MFKCASVALVALSLPAISLAATVRPVSAPNVAGATPPAFGSFSGSAAASGDTVGPTASVPLTGAEPDASLSFTASMNSSTPPGGGLAGRASNPVPSGTGIPSVQYTPLGGTLASAVSAPLPAAALPAAAGLAALLMRRRNRA
jgi:hypothetical protein